VASARLSDEASGRLKIERGSVGMPKLQDYEHDAIERKEMKIKNAKV